MPYITNEIDSSGLCDYYTNLRKCIVWQTTMQLFDLINDSPIDATLIGNAAQADTIANMLAIE